MRYYLLFFGIGALALTLSCSDTEPRPPSEPADVRVEFAQELRWYVPDRSFGLNAYPNSGDSLRDMNGDGRPDLLVLGTLGTVFADEGERYFEIYLNDGAGLLEVKRWHAPPGVVAFDHSDGKQVGCQGETLWRLADVNGDSLPDIIVLGEGLGEAYNCASQLLGSDFEKHVLVYRNHGAGFDSNPIHIELSKSDADLIGRSLAHLEFVDLNGDAKQEAVLTSDANTLGVLTDSEGEYWLSIDLSGTSTSRLRRWSIPKGGTPRCGFHTTTFMLPVGAEHPCADIGTAGIQHWALRDINGDGAVDLLILGEHRDGSVFLPSMEPRAWDAYLNTGNGFEDARALALPQDADYQYTELVFGGSIAVEDLDGDGWVELIDMRFADDRTSPTWRVYRFSTSGLADTPEYWSVPVPSPSLPFGFVSLDGVGWRCSLDGDCGTWESRWLTLDLNGDSFVELVHWEEIDGAIAGQSPHAWTVWTMANP